MSAPTSLSTPFSRPVTETLSLIRLGGISLTILLVGLGIGSTLMPINGAVIAQGQFLVEGKSQPVQSLTPGSSLRLQ